MIVRRTVKMAANLSQSLMEEYADATGISGDAMPRRYLWNDAFAVCNFLDLFDESGNEKFLGYAREIVHQVHHILGRHRDDDPRSGWISGLSEESGEQHPTIGGLRIGKPLNERQPHEVPNPALEWEQDGQYFHYLTKWTHALARMGEVTRENRFSLWAIELAEVATRKFTYVLSAGGPKQMVWKMSIDLSRPLVTSMGQHDPLDGLVTCLELQTCTQYQFQFDVDLTPAIMDMTAMCAKNNWVTLDPLGIGGLLDDASRLARLVFEREVMRHDLLHQLLFDARSSLALFSSSYPLADSAARRLAFRELGLCIGMHALERISPIVAQNREFALIVNELLTDYQSLACQINAFWSDVTRRQNKAWEDHRDINSVMLATSLITKRHPINKLSQGATSRY